MKNLTPGFAPATSISYKTDIFPLPSYVYGIYSIFLCYYVACDVDPFDIESVSYTVLLMKETYTNFEYPTTIGYLVMISVVWGSER